MYLKNIRDIPAEVIATSDTSGLKKQILVSPREGWDGWVMRRFSLDKEGWTPRHSHPWPHIAFILSGKGILFVAGEKYEVSEGSVTYIPSDALHQFTNTGEDKMTFLCIVPERGEDSITDGGE